MLRTRLWIDAFAAFRLAVSIPLAVAVSSAPCDAHTLKVPKLERKEAEIIDRFQRTWLQNTPEADQKIVAELRAVVDEKTRRLGSHSSEVVKSRLKLADMLASIQKYAEAEREYRKVLELRLRRFGSGHFATREVLLGLW